MRSFLLALFIPFFIACSNSSEEIINNEDIIQIDDMFLLKSDLYSEKIESSEVKESGFQLKNSRLWENGKLPYVFSNQLTNDQKKLFLQSCREVGEFAKIDCRPKSAQDKDYLYIKNTNERICGSSFIGRRGGKQNLSIACWRKRTIQHELMHALGIPHEQNRPDRDNYLSFRWENLDRALLFNFQKVSLSHVKTWTKTYDFDSIMHYDSYSGTKNGEIVFYRKDLGPLLGKVRQSNEMSYYDHYTLYHIYDGIRPSKLAFKD